MHLFAIFLEYRSNDRENVYTLPIYIHVRCKTIVLKRTSNTLQIIIQSHHADSKFDKKTLWSLKNKGVNWKAWKLLVKCPVHPISWFFRITQFSSCTTIYRLNILCSICVERKGDMTVLTSSRILETKVLVNVNMLYIFIF